MDTRIRNQNDLNPNPSGDSSSAEDWMDAGLARVRSDSADLMDEVDRSTQRALSVNSEDFNRRSKQTGGQ